MGTKKVVDVIGDALEVCHDNGVRFPKAQLLKFYNQAVQQLCADRPDAFATNTDHSLVTNQSKQTLPASGTRLLEVVRNTVSGKVVREIPRDVLDVHDSSWHSVTGEPQQYVYDPRDPKTFYVYPHPTTAHQLEIIYAKTPDEVAVSNFDTDTQTIECDDLYVNALADFILWRAYSKDSQMGNMERALAHLQAYSQAIGKKSQIDAQSHPRQQKG